MKKFFFIPLALGLLLQSCDLNHGIRPENISDKDDWGMVTFTLSNGEDLLSVRSSSIYSESAITSLTVVVYNSSGNTLAYGSANANSLSLNVPLGTTGNSVFAIVNKSGDYSSFTKEQLLTQVSDLSDNNASSLVMFGGKDNVTFAANQPVEVPVTRFASRVEIDGITTDMKAPHTTKSFKVNSIYLINACTSAPFSQSGTGSAWMNKKKYEQGSCDALLYEAFSTPREIQTAAGVKNPITDKHYFYCYQNLTSSDTHGGSWSPRRTRLVIETTLGSDTWYYPIDIVDANGVLPLNSTFTVTSLTITGLGVKDPDDELNLGSISFTVKVTDWATGFSKTVTY